MNRRQHRQPACLRAGAVDDFSYESLLEHCSRNLSYFMVPRYVQILDALPRTLSEKIEKYKLRQAAEADLDALWDRERAGIEVAR